MPEFVALALSPLSTANIKLLSSPLTHGYNLRLHRLLFPAHDRRSFSRFVSGWLFVVEFVSNLVVVCLVVAGLTLGFRGIAMVVDGWNGGGLGLWLFLDEFVGGLVAEFVVVFGWVMCDAYDSDGQPIPKNKRYAAAKISAILMLLQKSHEYILFPLGWPVGGYPGPQGPYYCNVGAERAKDIVESQYKACLYAGINISTINGEAMPGEVGPVVGISAGDELWVARYILEVIYEIAGVVLPFDPKPIQGDRIGAGTLTIFSPNSMRKEGGFEVLKAAKKIWLWLKKRVACGEGNDRRLTGEEETADTKRSKTFKWGAANRVAPDMDPNVVTSMIAETRFQIFWFADE
ncbi:hypothetical protein Patl1_21185 [Pistacia atlantica]|uniref:Uncharacterized protein n=1 Tax=Pistacia atlantica TaxID=434234 RepID=A0ACC1BLN3_9ROSI|nr:hypothetical protein Patl1_21185 [Pistacia atlantica]